MIPQYILDKFVDVVGKDLVQDILGALNDIDEAFVPKRFKDELHGIADGTNGTVPFKTIRNLNLVSEAIRASCTLVGAWGPATKDGKLH